MAAERVRIDRIKVKDIVQFAAFHADGGERGQVVPISKLRAASHASNPYADPDDVCLLVAMQGDECVGYVGVMPSMLQTDGKLSKLNWYSTWYSGTEGQQVGAGGLLLHASLSLGYDTAATDLADVTLPYYRKLRFKPLGPLTYFELNLDRLDILGAPWLALRVLLRRRGRSLSALDRVFATCRGTTKSLFYGALGKEIARMGSDLEFREVSELPRDFSMAPSQGISFFRGPETIRWRLNFPWITERLEEATRGYYFSDLREMVRFAVVEVRLSNETSLGYVVISISRHQGRTTVKILDRFLDSQSEPRVLISAGMEYARRYRADRLIIPEQCQSYIRQSFFLRRLLRAKTRLYFCYPKRNGSVLPEDLDTIRLDYCDGDTPFT